MKRLGILLILLLTIFTLSSCDQKEVDFFDCTYDSTCVTATIRGEEESDSEVIKFVHSSINESTSLSIIPTETIIDYDEFEIGDIKLTVIIYQTKSSSTQINIGEFNDLFNQLKAYFNTKSIVTPYFKLEIRTPDTIARNWIALNDDVKKLSIMQVSRGQYSAISDDEKIQINNTFSNFDLFDKVNYWFIFSEYNILFDYEKSTPLELRLEIVLGDEATVSTVPIAQIHQFYQSVINDSYTIILEDNE